MRNFLKEIEERPWYKKIWSFIYYKSLFAFEFIRYDVPNGVRNIINWVPVIWGHYDFDHSYLLDVMSFKLKLIRNRMQKYSYEIEEDKSKRLQDIQLAINLIKKIREGYYEHELYDYYKADYDFVPTDDADNGEKMFSMESTCLTDNLDQYFDRHKLRVRQVIKENPERFKDYDATKTEDKLSLAIWVGQAQHKKAVKLLFAHLGEKIEGFWY